MHTDRANGIIVPLLEPHPFGVAMLTRAHRNGELEYQWWGNATNNVMQKMQPGWISHDDGKDSQPHVYYGDTRRKPEDGPYLGHTGTPMTQRDVVAHSFQLTPSGRLPAVVLKATDEDYRVWWTMKPIKAHTTNKRKNHGGMTSTTNNTQHESTKHKIPGEATNNTQHESSKRKKPGEATDAIQLEHDKRRAPDVTVGSVCREATKRKKPDGVIPCNPDDTERADKRPRATPRIEIEIDDEVGNRMSGKRGSRKRQAWNRHDQDA